MARSVGQLADEVRNLRNAEELQQVDAILVDLDRRDTEVERVWLEGSRHR